MNGEYVVNQVQRLWKEKKYKVIVLGIVTVLMLATFVQLGHGNILEVRNTTGRNYWLVLYVIIGILAFGGFAFYICKVSKQAIEKIYLMMAIVFGVLFMTILPPYSMADEMCHIDTTYYYSSILLGKQAVNDEGEVLYRENDLMYDNDANHLPSTRSLELVITHFFERDHSSTYVSVGRKPLNILPISYLPQIIGVTLARIFHMGNIMMLFMGRVFGMAFAIACFCFAIKITPIGKDVIALSGLLPMTLELITSYSYDSTTIALSVLYLGLLLHLIFEVPKITWKHWIQVAVIIAWLTPAKVVYMCLAMTLLCIPKEKFSGRVDKYLGTVGVLVLGAIIILLTRLAHVKSIASGGGLATYGYETYNLVFFEQHPVELVKIIYHTIETQTATWIMGMLGQSLGWMEILVPVHLMIGFIILCVLASIRTENEAYVLNHGQRLWSTLVVLGISGLVCIALLFDITPAGQYYVWGVQGRYFLPMLPLVMILFKNQQIVKKTNMVKYLMAGAYILDYFVIMYVLGVVTGR